MARSNFNLTEFEKALPVHKETSKPLWRRLGLVQGEYCFIIPVRDNVNIMIRSSVRFGGKSAPYGEDSIRAYLLDSTGSPLGSKAKKYVHRSTGWQVRLKAMLRTLYKWGLYLSPCPKCGDTPKIFKIREQSNKDYGKIFIKCEKHGELRLMEGK